MRPLFVLLLIGVVTCLAYCTKRPLVGGGDICETTGPIIIYKTRLDYTNKVFVRLSDDRKTVTSYPDPIDIHKPVGLVNGYYLPEMGGNAVLSVTIDEYPDFFKNTPHSEFAKYVLDSKPFLEYYDVCHCAMRGVSRHDTASLTG